MHNKYQLARSVKCPKHNYTIKRLLHKVQLRRSATTHEAPLCTKCTYVEAQLRTKRKLVYRANWPQRNYVQGATVPKVQTVVHNPPQCHAHPASILMITYAIHYKIRDA